MLSIQFDYLHSKCMMTVVLIPKMLQYLKNSIPVKSLGKSGTQTETLFLQF